MLWIKNVGRFLGEWVLFNAPALLEEYCQSRYGLSTKETAFVVMEAVLEQDNEQKRN